MKEDINNIKNEALAQIMEADSTRDLEELRIQYLGRQGKISLLIKNLKKISPGDRKAIGALVNDVKSTISTEISERKNNLKENARQWFDPTIPGIRPPTGNLHLVSSAINDIVKVFAQLGFIRVRYPEADWDWYAFESLNMPKDHPARDEWETFFIDQKPHPKLGQVVLTPHTSNGQVREMQRVRALSTDLKPIRMINIAKCYRRQSDISHVPMFHQFEGLVVDKNISIAHLKGTLDYFARNYFGPDRQTRLRPYHFQFTEPSFEVDVTCDICKGKGCKVCKEGWLEMGGAGMVHPNVLKAGGIDPAKYSGFAFGWGVERVLLMKSGLNIPDLRLLYSTDLRFLTQF